MEDEEMRRDGARSEAIGSDDGTLQGSIDASIQRSVFRVDGCRAS